MKNFKLFLGFLALISACNPQSKSDVEVMAEMVDTLYRSESIQDPNQADAIPKDHYLIDASSEQTPSLVRNRLSQLHVEDLKLGIIDSLSCKFIFFEYDLNGDSSKEIFVGLTGPFFCGSGGCTQYLLSAQGEVISKFTVSDYPVVISTDKTEGWNDLLMLSNGDFHVVKFGGKSYPGNPSVLPKLGIIPGDGLPRALDFMNDNYPWFSF